MWGGTSSPATSRSGDEDPPGWVLLVLVAPLPCLPRGVPGPAGGSAGHCRKSAGPYLEDLARRRAARLPAALIPVSAGESSTVVSPYLPGGVSDGQWHTLQLRYYNKVASPVPVGLSARGLSVCTACCPRPEVSLVAPLCPFPAVVGAVGCLVSGGPCAADTLPSVSAQGQRPGGGAGPLQGQGGHPDGGRVRRLGGPAVRQRDRELLLCRRGSADQLQKVSASGAAGCCCGGERGTGQWGPLLSLPYIWGGSRGPGWVCLSPGMSASQPLAEGAIRPPRAHRASLRAGPWTSQVPCSSEGSPTCRRTSPSLTGTLWAA